MNAVYYILLSVILLVVLCSIVGIGLVHLYWKNVDKSEKTAKEEADLLLPGNRK